MCTTLPEAISSLIRSFIVLIQCSGDKELTLSDEMDPNHKCFDYLYEHTCLYNQIMLSMIFISLILSITIVT